MPKTGWVLIPLWLSAALTGCVGDTEDPDSDDTDVEQDGYCEGTPTGRLLWTHDSEPPDLHLDDPENNLSIVSWVRQSLLEGLYGETTGIDYHLELLATPAVITEDEGGFTYAFTLRDDLMWSDGTRLTAYDVQGTYEIIMEGVDGPSDPGVYKLGNREGYVDITSFEVTSDTEFAYTMQGFYAGYPALFAEVFPSHVLSDAATANAFFPSYLDGNGEPLPSSGPLVFTSWDGDAGIVLERNALYHGSQSPDAKNPGAACVEAVVLTFMNRAVASALQSGDAHFIFTQPLPAMQEIASDPAYTVASSLGPVFEHWGFNLLDTHLGDPKVREAVAFAMDKTELVADVYSLYSGADLLADGLGNTYLMGNHPAYVDHQSGYAVADLTKAASTLESAGYTLGDDNIYTHAERGRLSLRAGTTGGNGVRETVQGLLQTQLAKAGIEIVIDNVAGGAYFGARPFSEEALAAAMSGGAEGDSDVWDITQFAWVGGPWPGPQSSTYRSGSGNNPYGFANAAFDAQADECDQTVDDDERTACYNDLDRYVTTLDKGDDGLFMIPLTQRSSFFAYDNAVVIEAAAAPDSQRGGPLVNAQDWRL